MPRFYFDISDGEDVARDETGLVCDDWEAMSKEAVTILPDLARDELPNGPSREFWVKVRDESGKCIFEASLVLATSWHGRDRSGELTATHTLTETRHHLRAIRKVVALGGHMDMMQEIDALVDVAEQETERKLHKLE